MNGSREHTLTHLWPHGIHVALVIVDGIVDEPLMRAKLTDKPDGFFVKPEDIADTLVSLTWQRRSAWSFRQRRWWRWWRSSPRRTPRAGSKIG
ncbi:MAG: hypothetical protein AB7O57_01090 [Hyphomicrobiaceae bacterium]